MRIIRPVDISDSVESNAPEDESAQWEPIGPEYAEDLSGPLVSASDSYIYVMDQADGTYDLRQHDPTTGTTTVVDLNWQGAGIGRSIYVAVSPDDSRIAVVFQVTAPTPSYRIDLYDSNTGEANYSADIRWQRWSRVLFSRDSSRLISKTMRDNSGTFQERITFVDTSTYAEAHSDWVENPPASDEVENSATGIAYDNSAGVAYAWFNRPPYAAGRIMRFDGASTTQFNHGFASPGGAPIIFDEAGGQLGTMVSLNEVIWRDSVTMAQISSQSLPAGFRAFEETQNGESVYFVFVTSPLIREFDLASRQVTNSTSPVRPNLYQTFGASQYRSITLSSGYMGVRQDEGFTVIDLLDMSEITQTNPTVTTGDIYTYQDHNYEALTDNNDRPDTGATLDPPTWLDLGFVNPLRMFDNKLDSLTVGPSPLVIDITPGALVNGIALFNVDATTVQITQTDPTEGVVYDTGEVRMVDASTITGWYEFFFGPRLKRADLARIDLLPYKDATITITLRSEGADVSIGQVVPGRLQTLGIAQYGTSVGITDFSRKETDQFGNFVITPRRFSKRAEYDVRIPTAQNAGVQRTLAALRTTPIVWVGDETKEETVVYGYYRDFDILLAGPSLSDGTITVEGL